MADSFIIKDPKHGVYTDFHAQHNFILPQLYNYNSFSPLLLKGNYSAVIQLGVYAYLIHWGLQSLTIQYFLVKSDGR